MSVLNGWFYVRPEIYIIFPHEKGKKKDILSIYSFEDRSQPIKCSTDLVRFYPRIVTLGQMSPAKDLAAQPCEAPKLLPQGSPANPNQ
jgi:hypothetical protein